MRSTVLLLLLTPGLVLAQTSTTPGSAGSGANATAAALSNSTAPPTPAVDPRLAELDRQIELTKKQTALLLEQKSLQQARNDVLRAEYPLATVTPKNGDATTFENTAFLADWLLSANIPSLVPKPGDTDALACSVDRPTLVVGADSPAGPSLILAETMRASITSLTRSANRWVAAAEAQARKKKPKQDKDNLESGLIDGLMMGQSVVTQTLDLIKYFRTDVDFKTAPTSLPTYALRSELARHCPGARLPEMAIPSNSPIVADYIALSDAADTLRLALASHADKLADEMKSGGVALLATIDAYRTQLTAPIASQPTLLVQAAQILSQQDVDHVLTVRVMDEGGTAIKRSNLFFLTPRFSYVAAVSVDYVLTDRQSGAVLWHTVRQARSQLNQKYSPWRGTGVDVLTPPKSRVQ